MASEVASETSKAYSQARLALTFKFAALVSAEETVMRGSLIYLVRARDEPSIRDAIGSARFCPIVLVNHAFFHYEKHVLSLANILQRITGNSDDISRLASFQGANFVGKAE
jgi:hypothetical protein